MTDNPETNKDVSLENEKDSKENKKDAVSEEATDGEEIRGALAEIRREYRKAALIYASLDAVCVLLAVDFVATAVGASALDAEVAATAFDSVGLPAPDLGTLIGVLAGVVAFAAEFAVRIRRPAAEQFEAANPEIREALRTARDAAESDRDDGANPMTRALYADVLEKLRETSSVGLLNATRLAATVVVALALSLATVQTAVVGVDLGVGPAGSGPGSGGSAGTPADRALSNQTAELQSSEEVLGEPTDVTAGSENLSAAVSASPGGEGQRDWNYDSGAGAEGETESGDAQRAGFASPDRVEDAALVQRYAHQLAENSTDD